MTTVTICSVGTEVVLGDQVDSNAAWLSQRLREIGVEVRYHVAAGDDLDMLVPALRWCIEISDAVIVGGGLGPTPDDLTREAVAAALELPLEERDDLVTAITEQFESRGWRMASTNRVQARVPSGARAFPPLGTAPGFTCTAPGGCVVYVLPGVPWELQQMYARDVAPDLLRRTGGGASVTRTVHVTGMGESSVAEALGPVLADVHGHDEVAVSFLATGTEVQVRMTASGVDPEDARARCQPVVDAVRGALGRAVAGIDAEDLEDACNRLLREAGQSVAFAESATAGGISARMAQVPGASEVMRGGVAVYSTASKTGVLGVPGDLVEEHSPVSEAVTRAMAERVRDLFAADWGVAVTGVAGPGTQGGKPIGSVYWAVTGPDGETVCREGTFAGDRAAVLDRLGSAALELLRRRLLDRDDGA